MKTVDNSQFKTTLEIGAGKPKQVLWYLVNLLFIKNRYNVSSGLKVFLLNLFGAKIGKGVVIKPGVNIKYPWKLFIGNHTWIGEGVWIDNLSNVYIGNNVTLSQGATIITGTHNYRKVTFDFLSAEVTLEDGVWIGAKAFVRGNVICKSHSILSINSVALSNLEPYTIYQGNPAVPIKKREITA